MRWMGRRKGDALWDDWSWAHVASGAGLRIARIRWPVAVGLMVGFEALEAFLRTFKVSDRGLFEYESWPNIVGDVVFGAAGYAVADGGLRLWRQARDARAGTPAQPAVIVALSRGQGAGRVRPTR